MNVKVNDNVLVIAGKDKGVQGKVLATSPKANTVIVEGVNMATIHKKPRRQGDTGGIIHQEAAINMSNVMHICKKCGKPTRIGYKLLADGKKARMCKHCLEILD